mmetsp:Transcript_22432/g.64422  ORF Transcript_22432/g.64422 Transcript_22432/m.64422 type:complete len:254 (-) Transcript_22432:128-889(-)
MPLNTWSPPAHGGASVRWPRHDAPWPPPARRADSTSSGWSPESASPAPPPPHPRPPPAPPVRPSRPTAGRTPSASPRPPRRPGRCGRPGGPGAARAPRRRPTWPTGRPSPAAPRQPRRAASPPPPRPPPPAPGRPVAPARPRGGTGGPRADRPARRRWPGGRRRGRPGPSGRWIGAGAVPAASPRAGGPGPGPGSAGRPWRCLRRRHSTLCADSTRQGQDRRSSSSPGCDHAAERADTGKAQHHQQSHVFVIK